jgi:glycerol kinase
MRADATTALSELRVDGGAAANNMLMQFQADVLGVPIVRPVVTETTALGAAYLAGLGVGYWPSADALTGQWRVDRRFDPSMPRSEVGRLRERWSAAVQRSRGWMAD